MCLDQAGSGALQDENVEPQGNFFHSLHLLYVNENPITLIDFPLVYTSVNGRKIRFQSTLRERMTIILSFFAITPNGAIMKVPHAGVSICIYCAGSYVTVRLLHL